MTFKAKVCRIMNWLPKEQEERQSQVEETHESMPKAEHSPSTTDTGRTDVRCGWKDEQDKIMEGLLRSWEKCWYYTKCTK